MSVDTTLVIAARTIRPYVTEYSAAIVQAAEDLSDPDPHIAAEKFESYFGRRGQPWFSNLGLAKSFGHLLACDARVKMALEYEKPILLVCRDGVLHRMSNKGRTLGLASKWGDVG